MRLWNLFSTYDEAPTETRVYPCPACNEIISADARTCRFCDLPIDTATAEQLRLENQRVTNAVASANTYRLSVLFAAFVILNGVMNVLIGHSWVWVLVSVGSIGYGVSWLYRYRSLITRDSDYPLAVRRVKLTTIVWIVALVAPLAIVAYGFATKKTTSVEVQGTNTPVFVFSGPGTVTNFSVGVFSPSLPEDSPNRVQLIWQIDPYDIFNTKVESLGHVTYGTVPEGFAERRSALPMSPLEPGKYYVFYLLTMNAPDVKGAFEMKDGKPSRVYGLPFCIEFNENLKGVWTRCPGDEDPAK